MTEPTGEQSFTPDPGHSLPPAAPLAGYQEPAYGQPAYQQPAAPGYGQPAYQQPAAPGYGQPAYYQQPYPTAPPTNQKALIAMILGLVGFLTWITSIPAIILGHMAKKEIARTGEAGHGMALTGLITGYVVAIGGLLFIVAYVLFIAAMIASSN